MNIYLHPLDARLQKEIPEMRYVRYADDITVGLTSTNQGMANQILEHMTRYLGPLPPSKGLYRTQISNCLGHATDLTYT